MTVEEFRKLNFAGHVTENRGYTYIKYYPPKSCNIDRRIEPGDIFCKKDTGCCLYFICTSVLTHYSAIKKTRVDTEYKLSKLLFMDSEEYEVYTIVNDTDENFLNLRYHKKLHGTLDLRIKLVATIPDKHYDVLSYQLRYKDE